MKATVTIGDLTLNVDVERWDIQPREETYWEEEKNAFGVRIGGQQKTRSVDKLTLIGSVTICPKEDEGD